MNGLGTLVSVAVGVSGGVAVVVGVAVTVSLAVGTSVTVPVGGLDGVAVGVSATHTVQDDGNGADQLVDGDLSVRVAIKAGHSVRAVRPARSRRPG
jgi:hypothetical protein